MTGVLRGSLNRSAAAQHDQVGQRDLLATRRRRVEALLDGLQRLQHLGQLGGLVNRPILLRRQANARPVGPTALVGAAESRRRGPGGRHQLADRQAAGQDLGLQGGDVLRIDQRMVDRGDRVLPDQLFGRHQRAQVAGERTHVAVGQLEPGAGKRVGQGLRVGQEAARDRLVDRVHPQRQVGRRHHRRVALRRIVGIGHDAGRSGAGGRPLVGASRALGQHPFVAEQGLEVAVVPLDGVRRPGAFQAAADGVHTLAAAESALPAQALLLDAGSLGLGAHIGAWIGSAVALAEGVSAGHQRHRLFVIHGHAGEGLADVARRSDRVGLAVRPLRVDVDQAHLDGGQRVFQHTVAAVALVAQPLAFRPPVDVFFRRPDVLAATGKAEGLEAHRIERNVAGEHDQVGPGNLAAVFLLDRPNQPPRLVEAHIVGPAVERRKTLCAAARAAAAIADAVGARAVPGHADEKRPVVAVVSRPPVL